MPRGELTPEARKNAAKGLSKYWYSMTAEQRSAEMRRRRLLSLHKKKAISNDPFGTVNKLKEEIARSSDHPTVKDRIAAIEAAVTALKADLGL